MKAGERHVVLGRKGQGSSTFLNMLMGQVSLVKGRIDAQGKIGYLSGENFLLIDSLRSNLVFFNKTISEEKLVQVFKELGLND
jgi:ABC-type transport system involved in cytochrome bd biosynthesis fused ATPase/permease subunit